MEACLHLGLNPIVVDYFGDVDLTLKGIQGKYYLEQFRNEIGTRDALDHSRDDVSSYGPTPEGFRRWAIQATRKIVEDGTEGSLFAGVDPLILIGSGFDDFPSAWDTLATLGSVMGCTGDVITRCRDMALIKELVDESGISVSFPNTRIYEDPGRTRPHELMEDMVAHFKFPFILKRGGTAGGAGVNLIRGQRELNRALISFKEKRDGAGVGTGHIYPLIVQEFIGSSSRIDLSIISCDGALLSINKQIIGKDYLNSPTPFSYCGNEVPLNNLGKTLINLLTSFVQLLHEKVGLCGIYGVDFVLAENHLYFMEINPRIPGSLEPASVAHDHNFLMEHLEAFPEIMAGYLLNLDKHPRVDTSSRIPKFHAIKHILFARETLVMKSFNVKTLIGKIRDITPPGRMVNPGDPILTYLLKGKLEFMDRNRALAGSEISMIYNHLVERGKHE